MSPNVRRRTREPDPVVAARLKAISYADPYVFVHASDVLEAEPAGAEPQPVDARAMGGWVPDPPAPAQATARDPGPMWRELVRQRLEPARGGFAALVLLGLVAAVVAGVVYLRAQPSRTTSTLPARGSATSSAPRVVEAPRPTTPAVTLLVDVTGKVHRPGVVRLRNGARVIDAVRAAGGALPGTSLDSLNLASKLADGQQVAVGAAAAATVSAVPAGDTGSPAPAGPVDINTATVTELTTLPGIGPVLAQRIIDYRSAHGPFTSVEGLQQVGIGPSKFADLKGHVSA